MLPPSAVPARRLRKILSPLIEKAARESRADRYRKSFPARAHAWMLILHVMGANPSLRQSHAHQQADPALRGFLGMPGWVSYSQLARSSASRPAGFFEALLGALVRRACAGRAAGAGGAPPSSCAASGCWTPLSSPCARRRARGARSGGTPRG